MDRNVFTIFLSMSLTVAFTRIVAVETPTWGMWGVFLYFVFRKISYYVADARFADISGSLFRAETVTERMFHLLLGVASLFLFIVAGYYVTTPSAFFLWKSFALLINIFWLVLLMILVDPQKDKNSRLTVRTMFRNFSIINGVEILVCLIAGFWLRGKWEWKGSAFAELEPWVLGLGLGTLFFIMLIDFLLHKYFLFDPTYTCEDTRTAGSSST